MDGVAGGKGGGRASLVYFKSSFARGFSVMQNLGVCDFEVQKLIWKK